MSIFVVLILMLFAHIVDDYYLQGILAKMKQKGWWEENAPDKKYKYDYIVALICHSFSWAVMVLLPILFATSFNIALWLSFVFACNVAIHAIVDDLKANKKKINLIADQSIHFVQILITWLLWVLI